MNEIHFCINKQVNEQYFQYGTTLHNIYCGVFFGDLNFIVNFILKPR